MIIAIDTETTHYDPQRAKVLEIGAVAEDGQTYESLCDPHVDLSECTEALAVNGITKDEVQSARPVEDVAGEFRRWLSQFNDVELIAFNVKYDGTILARDPWSIPMDWWKHDVMFMALDIMSQAGVLPIHPYYGTPKWPRLSEAEAFFKVQRDGKSHRALSDALVTLAIFTEIRKRGWE